MSQALSGMTYTWKGSREQSYTLKYARQCWSAGLVYNNRLNIVDNVEKNIDQILFTIELKGIGAVKLY